MALIKDSQKPGIPARLLSFHVFFSFSASSGLRLLPQPDNLAQDRMTLSSISLLS